MALLGLAPDQNCYLDENRQWVRNIYVPAFVRRYPFVLAETGNENSSVCFDAAFEGWNEAEGQELFNDKGENSDFLNEVIRFLQGYSFEMKRTQEFVRRLQQLNLLQSKQMQLTHSSGQRFTINDFKAVDEEALARLSEAEILELHKAGFLGWIYAHLISLGSVNQLFERHVEKQGAAEPRKGAKRAKA